MSVPFVASNVDQVVISQLEMIEQFMEDLLGMEDNRRIAKKLGMEKAIARVKDSRARYEEPFRLAIVGEFNSGKSALINALLGQAGVVVEGVTPTTGAITELKWGPEERGVVFDKDGSELYSGTIGEAAKFADQRSSQGNQLKGKGVRVIMELPSDLLRSLIILDTPGLAANLVDDEVTLNSLHLADAAILVLNGLKPGGEDSVSLLEMLRRSKRRVVTVVSRLDMLTNPDKVMEHVADLFCDVSDGKPIGIASRNAVEALDALGQAVEANDLDAQKEAEEALRKSGYMDLRERLQVDYFSGFGEFSSTRKRAEHVKNDLATLLYSLHRALVPETEAMSESEAMMKKEVSEITRQMNDVVKHKLRLVNNKLEDYVDKYVAEFVAELNDAVGVFIEQVANGGVGLAFQSLLGKVWESQHQKLQARIEADFMDLFPPDQQDIMKSRLDRAVNAVFDEFWGDLELALKNNDESIQIDFTRLGERMTDEISKVMGAMTLESAAWVSLLFIPGGAILDAIWILISRKITSSQMDRATSTSIRLRNEARVKINSSRRTLVEKMIRHYLHLNETLGSEVRSNLGKFHDAKSKDLSNLTQQLEWWRDAEQRMIRIREDVLEGNEVLA